MDTIYSVVVSQRLKHLKVTETKEKTLLKRKKSQMDFPIVYNCAKTNFGIKSILSKKENVK